MTRPNNKGPRQVTIVKVPPETVSQMKERWVINKSSRELSQPEIKVLQRGLSFAVSPTKLPIVEFITSVEKACHLLGPNSEDANLLRSECVNMLKQAELPQSNICEEERKALRDLGDYDPSC